MVVIVKLNHNTSRKLVKEFSLAKLFYQLQAVCRFLSSKDTIKKTNIQITKK